MSLGSNICRCTGYRPILKAFKKFATDAPPPDNVLDIEDLIICKNTGRKCFKYRCEDSKWCIIPKQVPKNIIHFELHDHREFYKVEAIPDIFDILQEKGTNSYMLVAGNTAKGKKLKRILSNHQYFIHRHTTHCLKRFHL